MEPYAAAQEARKVILEVASDLRKLRLSDQTLSENRATAVKACEDGARKLAGVARDTTRQQLTAFVDAEIYPVEAAIGRIKGSASMILITYHRGNAPGLVFRSPENLAHMKQVITWMETIGKRMNKAIDTLERATGRLK